MRTVDERAVAYLDMLRDERFLELTAALKAETAETIIAFCRLVAKYENTAQLEFVRSLVSEPVEPLVP